MSTDTQTAFRPLKVRAWALGTLVLLYCADQVGCWNTVVTSRSPDQNYVVTIRERPAGPDSTLKVRFWSGVHFTDVVLEDDAWLGFTHVAWSPDSTKAGVIVKNRLGSTAIQKGYDFRTKTLLPYEAVRDLLADDIQRTYKLTQSELSPYHGDPVEWALRYEDAYKRVRIQP